MRCSQRTHARIECVTFCPLAPQADSFGVHESAQLRTMPPFKLALALTPPPVHEARGSSAPASAAWPDTQERTSQQVSMPADSTVVAPLKRQVRKWIGPRPASLRDTLARVDQPRSQPQLQPYALSSVPLQPHSGQLAAEARVGVKARGEIGKAFPCAVTRGGRLWLFVCPACCRSSSCSDTAEGKILTRSFGLERPSTRGIPHSA